MAATNAKRCGFEWVCGALTRRARIKTGPADFSTQMEDANRELRSVMFSLLHLPPLPAIVTAMEREDCTILSTDEAEPSHAILMSLVEWMAVMDNAKANSERMTAQVMLQAQFHAELAKLAPDVSDEAMYNFYCHHTRLWANAYTPLGRRMLFKPLDSISVGDKVHSLMLSYTKAQYQHFKEADLEISDRLSYIDMLRKCAEWSKEWNQSQEE